MEKIQLIIVFLIGANTLVAQDSVSFYDTDYESRNSGSFQKRATLISFGVGVPNLVNNFEDGHSGFPPAYFKYEHGFMRDEIGIGGHFSMGWGSFDNDNNSKTNFTAVSVGALMFYHFNKLISLKTLDLYVGAGLGYRHIAYTTNDAATPKHDPDDDILGIIRLGARYYVNSKFSFFAETGYDGMSAVNMGITLGLK